ncbi:hypothetical protein AMTR_s00068p00037100 [Amborella trichopoda]|uniref:Uncharacterized protein n=1 Tax=Amborella trichopoda TaxID=13333 RepID=U5DCW0_AMBTC|nr:hypothetical protein AMTR_s00068p00037100 [Amborella trichopoda]
MNMEKKERIWILEHFSKDILQLPHLVRFLVRRWASRCISRIGCFACLSSRQLPPCKMVFNPEETSHLYYWLIFYNKKGKKVLIITYGTIWLKCQAGRFELSETGF